MTSVANSIDTTAILPAEKSDVPEVLALQKVAYQSEAEIYGDDSLPALQQTLKQLAEDFDRMVFLKAVVNGKIIGSVRGYVQQDTAHLSRMIVHPYFQGRGLARRLMTDLEGKFPEVKRYEAFTGHKSKRNLNTLAKLGYQTFKTEQFSPTITWVYLQKDRL